MKFVLPFFLLFLSQQCLAHAFYFGFAEIEYNEFSQCMEGSIVLTTHDVELALEHETGRHISLSDSLFRDTVSAGILNQFIARGLQFYSSDGTNYALEIEGILVSLTGLVSFYFKTEPIQSTTCQVTFPMLMSHFNEQQNKVTFILRNKKETFNFIRPDTIHTLNLTYD